MSKDGYGLSPGDTDGTSQLVPKREARRHPERSGDPWAVGDSGWCGCHNEDAGMPNGRGRAGQHGTQSCLPCCTTTQITLCGACSTLDSVYSCVPYYQMVPEPNHRAPVLKANWMSLLLTIKWGETLPTHETLMPVTWIHLTLQIDWSPSRRRNSSAPSPSSLAWMRALLG